MPNYRFVFDTQKPRKKFACPQCGQAKSFVRYIDLETNEYLPDEFGKCDRENHCGYWLNPYSEGYHKIIFEKEKECGKSKQKFSFRPEPQTSFIPTENFIDSLKGYDKNNFITFLNREFGSTAVNAVIAKYYIGTSKFWHGATVFWQVDTKGRVRTGKIMHYSPITGKRTKEPYIHIDWAHRVLNLPEFNLKQCFFGEHLLTNEKYKPVAIVESEKTAIIASLYFDNYIWLSVGSLTNLTTERCTVLADRDVILFPDLNGYEKWAKKIPELSIIANFTISDYLEKYAPDIDKSKGYDLADYLIMLKR